LGLASSGANGALSSTDWTTFNNKQNALGYTPEDVANKSTDTGLGTSNTLYPSQGAVKSYVDTGLSGKENALGFTPENVTNKAINLTSPDNTKYPTTLAVSTALAGKQDILTNPITGTGVAGQVSFWTGTGTQSGDSGLFWDNVNKRLGVGTTTPDSPISILTDVDAVSSFTRVSNNAPTTSSLILKRTRGTLSNQTNVLNGDKLGQFIFTGLNSSNTFINSGAIFAAASEDFTSGSGTYISIENTSIGAFSRTERFRLFPTGNILIQNGGTFTDAGFRLDINGTARVQGAITTGAPTGGTAKPFKIGAVATVTPTSPNRTIEIEIDGTTYYLTAKTTND
jgi:hypothetical protein